MRRFYTLVMLCCAALFSHAQCPQFLNIDSAVCSGAVHVTANAGVLKTLLCGDSITIRFNAAGTTLAGDTNVYFHSGPEFIPFEGWRTAYTVGHWGLNDGVGRMTSVGTNLWAIRINPRTYYGYSVDSCLNGIFMDFRNFNGSVKAVNPDGSDIYLYTAPGTPTSTYAPVSGTTETHNNAVSYLWSDGNTDSVRTFTSATNLTVTATGIGGCTATGKVIIKTAHAPVNLGSDIVRCVPNSPATLNAGSGFVSYKWLDGPFTTNATYTATKPGCYWIQTLDSAGCSSTDEVGVHNSEVTNLLLPDSLGTCPGGHLSADASVNINRQGDSIVIIYNAAIGQTGLVGATKVYFHSGPEFHPFQGWVLNHTVGTWGVDNGVGQMTSLGNNKWRIAIDPYCYYTINPDTSLNGIWMVFRNADGSQSGKDSSGNNIFVYLAGITPTCVFTGVTPSRTARGPLTYNWSNSVNTAADNFTTSGVYTVTVSDNNGCSASDSVKVSFSGSLSINLGADTTICRGASVTLSAPANLAHYLWSNAATTQTISVSATGVYSLTATDTSGCQSTASRRVTVSTSQVNIGNDVVQCTRTPVTFTANTGFASYQWLSGPVSNHTTYTGTNPGLYWIKAIDSAGCASYDTAALHFSDVLGLSLPDTLTSCPGSFISLNANASIEQNGDSLVIIYDATTGQTGLIGASKVYFHSGPEFHAGSGWQAAYTIGNFGQDDGIGKMDSLGNNHWRIAIDPRTYYHINPDTPLTGIYMVFRNATGTQTGKDGNGNNIYVALPANSAPVSQFFGVYPFRASSGNITYLWSNGTPAASTAVSTPGVYTVTVTDSHSCTKTDSVHAIFGNSLTVSLGHDTTVCNGQSLILTPGAGYAHYSWSTGDSTASVTVHSTGAYSVTVTNGTCSATSTINVTVRTHLISIGTDTVRCTNAPVTLTASPGFSSYHWFGAVASSQTYSAVNAGIYWVKGIDASGCSSYDTVTVSNSSVSGLLLTDSLVSCGGDTLHFDAAASINANGDSLTIVYDATKGQSTLTGAQKVYFHSSPQFYAGTTWGSVTVGNWGLDDGVGKMTSLGNNKWTITINPRNYYHLNPDTPLIGIFMVFRNAAGTATGKDNAGNNILLNLTGNAPTSTFSGITGTKKAALPLTYNWSNGANTSATYATAGGTYTVTVADLHGCTKTDSALVIAGQSLAVNLGPDTTLCGNAVITLNAGTGYTSYIWSTGASTPSIFVSHAGNYFVTVTNSTGCTGKDSVVVTAGQAATVNLGHDTTLCGNAVITLNAGTGNTSYIWSTGVSTPSISVSQAATYSVTVINSSGCTGKDSVVVTAGQAATVSLGHDTTDCSPVVLNAGSGFTSYLWSNGASSASITVTTPGSYSVTISNSSGCHVTASVIVDSCNVVVVGCGSPVAGFVVQSISPGNGVTFRDTSHISKVRSYKWEFGDGTTGSQVGSVVHTYGNSGVYTVTLIVTDSCGGVDSVTRSVNVNATGIESVTGLSGFNLYPNPGNGTFNLDIVLQTTQSCHIILIDQSGQAVLTRTAELFSGRNLITIDAGSLASGVYILELTNNNERSIKKLTIIR